MKKIIAILLLLSSVMTVSSCKKEEKRRKDYYIKQDRNPEVVGTYLYYNQTNDTTDYQIWELFANGEKYTTSIYNGKKHRTKTPEYWYTSGNILHTYVFQKSWMYGSWEETSNYYMSPNKDTLYIDEAPFIKQ
jgi:uncharacterized protein YxeA